MCSTCPDITIFRCMSPETDRMSRALLLQAAAQYSGLTASQLGELETNPWGKPFFPQHPELHFSVSHSGDWWLCGFSSQPLGLDVQIHRSHAPVDTLSRRFFHQLEDAYLAQDGYRSFFDLWSAKESWVKYIGRGFFEDSDSFCVVSPDGRFPAMDGVHLQLLPFKPGYSLCLCTQTPGAVHFVDL